MKKRAFLKKTVALSSIAMLPSSAWALIKNDTLRTAHIGVGGMGGSDLRSISAHKSVSVRALCDVDSDALAKAKKMHPDARMFTDYRQLFDEIGGEIDAVIVSTPDHTHAPASLRAMQMGKSVYCQKPLSHHVSEARALRKLAADRQLVTQMGIQIHSRKEYRAAVILIQSGIIGKVKTVRAWSPKNWGYDGLPPDNSDPVPKNLDWNLWLGTAPERPYKDKVFHPANWRKLLDYGCGTLGDMGVHIFDTPYAALELDVPKTIKTKCRKPNGYGHPEENIVTYHFPGTKYTGKELEWVWYDGAGAPKRHKHLILPGNETLPKQGSMFIGEKGRLLVPHWDFPKLIVNREYEKIDFPELEDADHYLQFVDACLGKDECSTPFSYAARLTEAILLGVAAGRLPNKTLHWNNQTAEFMEVEANQFLASTYRAF